MWANNAIEIKLESVFPWSKCVSKNRPPFFLHVFK